MARLCDRRGYLSYRLQRGGLVHQLQTQRQVWLRVLANRADLSSRQTRTVSFGNAISDPRRSSGAERYPVIAAPDYRNLTSVSVQGESCLRDRGERARIGDVRAVTLPDRRPE